MSALYELSTIDNAFVIHGGQNNDNDDNDDNDIEFQMELALRNDDDDDNHNDNNNNKNNKNFNDVIIWGGVSYNTEEDSISKFVLSRKYTLQRFIFLPWRHKGGRMVRPHYYRSDRHSTMTFPSLKILGYYQDCGTPQTVRWIVPNLEKLYVFHGNRNPWILDAWRVAVRRPSSKSSSISISDNNDNNNNDDDNDYSSTDSSSSSNYLPQQVLEECPNLKEIICAIPDFKKPFQFQILRRLIPPNPLSWECLRLLEIVLKKEGKKDNNNNNNTDNDDDNTVMNCPMAMVPSAIMDLIVSFCHSNHWKIYDYNRSLNDID